MLELAMEDVDDDLETVDRTEHDQGEGGDRFTFSFDEVDELEAFGRNSVRIGIRREKGERLTYPM